MSKDKDYNQLIEDVKTHHICKVSFETIPLTNAEKITITSQCGNNTGHVVSVTFNPNGNILDINYTFGGYSNTNAVQENLNEVFEIINKFINQKP